MRIHPVVSDVAWHGCTGCHSFPVSRFAQPLSVVDWKSLQEYCLQTLFRAGRWTHLDSSVINTPELGLDQVT